MKTPQPRRWWSLILVVIATLLLILGNLGFWFRESILDSGNFTASVTDVLAEPEATSRISDVLAAQAVSSGELQAKIAETLPRQGPLLTALLGNELEAVIARSLQRILELSVVQDILKKAIEDFHRVLISTLEGDREGLTIEDDRLVLHLRGVLANLFERLGVPLPERLESSTAGDVTLIENASSLDNLSTVIRAVHDATPALLLFAFLGYVGTVLAAPRISRGLVVSGYGVLAAGIISLLLWRTSGWGVTAVLEELPVARMILHSLTEGFRWQSLLLVLLGIVLVVAGDGRIPRVISGWAQVAMQRVEAFGTGRALVLAGLALVILILIF